ncbi:MAG: hypothetical protein JWQ38_3473 [Flavipsychrobacter sp.]|nr:hypothetical protein [Flavipsychrobacter sp.]
MWTHVKYGIAVIIFVLILIVLYGVHLMSTFNGGAGALSTYKYPITKYELEKAVNSILKSYPNISRDSTVSFVSYDSTTQVTTYSLDSTNSAKREIDYYNDGIYTLRIKIRKDSIFHEYFIRYYGDSSSWNRSDESELGITYADGYSEGQRKPDNKIREKLIALFESDFIDRVDKELGITCLKNEK